MDLGMCMTSVLAKRMQLCSGEFRFENVLGSKILSKSALRSGILLASTEVIHRPRSHAPILFNVDR